MNKKYIFIDMDGTLLNNRDTITPVTIDCLKKASEYHEIIICTGRSVADCMFVLDKCPFIRYIIASNGAYVKDLKTNKILYSNNLSTKKMHKLIKYVLKRNLKISLHVDGYQYVNLYGEKREKVDTLIDCDIYEFINNRTIPQIVVIGSDFFKMLEVKKFIENDEYFKIQNHSYHLSKYSFDEINKLEETPLYYFMDVCKNNSSKGIGIERFVKSLGIDIKDTIAIGNGMNDVAMFEVVGLAVAVDNSPNEIKEKANLIIGSNIDDGVGKYLLTLCE